MSDGSILGLEEDLQTKGKRKTRLIPKVKISPILKKEKKEEVSYASAFFRGKSVFVKVQDVSLNKIVKIAMQKVGATILQDASLIADIVISEKPINIVPPALGRSRGSALVKSFSLQAQTPINVLISQIPWIYTIVSKELQSENLNLPSTTTNTMTTPSGIVPKTKISNQIDVVPDKTMIVADTLSRFRPQVQVLRNIPTLYFGDTPKGYTVSPFEPLPDDFGPSMERIKSHLIPKGEHEYQKEPSNNAYCELCCCYFKNAAEHHNSAEHKYHMYTHIWDDFDEISTIITQKRFNTLPV